MKKCKYSACLLGVALLCVCARAAAKHPFGPEDWANLHSAQPVAVAPDGNTIRFTRDASHLYGAFEQNKHRRLATIAIGTPFAFGYCSFAYSALACR